VSMLRSGRRVQHVQTVVQGLLLLLATAQHWEDAHANAAHRQSCNEQSSKHSLENRRRSIQNKALTCVVKTGWKNTNFCGSTELGENKVRQCKLKQSKLNIPKQFLALFQTWTMDMKMKK
jgi:hypothetical protein